MAKLPYPPAPELGWYSDDPVEGTRIPQLAQPNRRTTTGSPVPRKRQPIPLLPQSLPPRPPPLSPLPPLRQTPHRTPPKTTSRIGTAPCSPPRSSKAPKKTYLLHNDVTGQTIVIDKSTLLGRKPSMDVPQGAKAVRIRPDPHHIPQPCRHQHRHRWRAVDRGLRLVERHLLPRCVSETSSSSSKNRLE